MHVESSLAYAAWNSGLGRLGSAPVPRVLVQGLSIPAGLFGGVACGLPGKPVACNYGLPSINNGLLWAIVAHCFGLLGFPGKNQGPTWAAHGWAFSDRNSPDGTTALLCVPAVVFSERAFPHKWSRQYTFWTSSKKLTIPCVPTEIWPFFGSPNAMFRTNVLDHSLANSPRLDLQPNVAAYIQ